MTQVKNFTFQFYFQTLTKLLGEPRKFFSKLSRNTGLKQPFKFLLVSSLFYTGGSLMSNPPLRPVVMGSIFFVNAMGMVFIAAGIGYMVMTMIMGRQVTFARLFSIYAFSVGVTLLASWLPFFVWLTEPWKWWLIGTGMIKCCGFRLSQVLVIIGASIGVMFLLFWSVIPIMTSGG